MRGSAPAHECLKLGICGARRTCLRVIVQGLKMQLKLREETVKRLKAAATGEKINWTAMDPAVMIEGTKMAAAEKEGARTLEKLRKTKAEADQINSLLKAASTKRLKKEKQAAVERAAEVEAINARVAGKASSSDAAEVPRGPGVG